MKTFKLIRLFTLYPLSLRAQYGYIKTEKDIYKIDELIKVTFYSFNKVDSVSDFKFQNFPIITGPSTQKSTSIDNVKTKFQHVISYTLKAKKNGKLIIK